MKLAHFLLAALVIAIAAFLCSCEATSRSADQDDPQDRPVATAAPTAAPTTTPAAAPLPVPPRASAAAADKSSADKASAAKMSADRWAADRAVAERAANPQPVDGQGDAAADPNPWGHAEAPASGEMGGSGAFSASGTGKGGRKPAENRDAAAGLSAAAAAAPNRDADGMRDSGGAWAAHIDAAPPADANQDDRKVAACTVAPMPVPSAPTPRYEYAPSTNGRPVAPAAPGLANNAPDNRDLGHGADTEPLGNPQANQIDPAGEVAMVDPENPGERYAQMHDNPFIRTSSRGGDASTFGLDVDSASYANCRRYLTELGRLPPVDAVRIEELINTLPYNYPAPVANDPVPFRSDTAVAACPWAPERLLVRLALRARTYDNDTRPPLNLVFLVDTSGSMGEPDKLPLVKESLRTLTGRLDARDHVAIVTYAGTTGTPLPWICGDEHRAIRRAIDALETGGGTNGAGGIVAAYQEASKGVIPGAVSRVLLCTDGDFNIGVSDHDGLLKLIERERTTGVFLNVYGFGMGNIKDDTMELLADHGNGSYGYIDSSEEADRLFKREAMGQLVPVAKDAKVQVFFNPAAVASWRLIGYEKRVLNREDFNNDSVDSGDVGAGHTVTALYEIVPARGFNAPQMPALRDANPFISRSLPDDDNAPQCGFAAADNGVLLRMRLRWKAPTASRSCLQEYDVPAVATAMDADFKTAAAAAGFGMMLRCSPWRGSCSWSLIDQLAKDGAEGDDRAARQEFVDLIEQASRIVHSR